jgi:hypothetical protein
VYWPHTATLFLIGNSVTNNSFIGLSSGEQLRKILSSNNSLLKQIGYLKESASEQ